MAGDWIKIEHVTPDKPEVISMAEILDIDQDAVFGKLCRIWIWADQQTLFGCAVSVTEKFVDRVSGVVGFAAAMKKAGWLVTEKGNLTFPNFSNHNGQTAKTRGLAVKRMQRSRCAGSATKAQPEIEIEKEKEKGKYPLPLLLQTPDFQSAWEDWQRHRREIGKTLKPTTIKAQLAKLDAMGPERAVSAIRHSIEGGWQGIFEPTGKGKGKQVKPKSEEWIPTPEELRALNYSEEAIANIMETVK